MTCRHAKLGAAADSQEIAASVEGGKGEMDDRRASLFDGRPDAFGAEVEFICSCSKSPRDRASCSDYQSCHKISSLMKCRNNLAEVFHFFKLFRLFPGKKRILS